MLEPDDVVKAIQVILILIIGGFLIYYILKTLLPML
jgi:hypothetical protein